MLDYKLDLYMFTFYEQLSWPNPVLLLRNLSGMIAQYSKSSVLGYEKVYLPLYKVADTPFHIQGDAKLSRWHGNSRVWLLTGCPCFDHAGSSIRPVKTSYSTKTSILVSKQA